MFIYSVLSYVFYKIDLTWKEKRSQRILQTPCFFFSPLLRLSVYVASRIFICISIYICLFLFSFFFFPRTSSYFIYGFIGTGLTNLRCSSYPMAIFNRIAIEMAGICETMHSNAYSIIPRDFDGLQLLYPAILPKVVAR